MRQTRHLLLASLLTTGLVAGTLAAAPAGARPAADFPRVIALPDGFQPEGVTIRPGRAVAWFGSLADGSVYRVDLRTGRGEVAVPGKGVPAVGLKVDRRDRLFVAGGPDGSARVVDGDDGRTLKTFRLTKKESFVNDVVLTRRAAWFTDSFQAQLYALPLGPDGELPRRADVITLPLGGDWEQGDDFGANGIARTPDGTALLVVHSTQGRLHRVDPASGVTTVVDLDGAKVKNGDGLLLRRRILYVVQNQLNRVAVLKLDRTGTSGRLVRTIRSPAFDVPTTVARLGDRLYLPNARFGTTPTPSTPYTAVKVLDAR